MGLRTVFWREFTSYFSTPLAYVFLIIFLVMQGLFTFYMGQFFVREQADLASFFAYHPWLYLFLIPALGMGLWADERRAGTMELLFTLPLGTGALVWGKYLAALVFVAVGLAMTFPVWITVSWLGDPDHGVIIVGYLGSFLVAAGFLAIASAASSVTSNQVTSFIVTAVICFVFLLSGLPLVLDFLEGWAPDWLMVLVANMSFLTRYDSFGRGVISAADVVYFVAVIVAFLWLTGLGLTADREARS